MKTVLVTGATRGIGNAIAKEFKKNNFSVIGTATSESGVATLHEQNIKGYVLDLNSKDSINSFWEKLENDDQKMIEILMGDEVAPRKDFITSNALDVTNLDI